MVIWICFEYANMMINHDKPWKFRGYHGPPYFSDPRESKRCCNAGRWPGHCKGLCPRPPAEIVRSPVGWNGLKHTSQPWKSLEVLAGFGLILKEFQILLCFTMQSGSASLGAGVLLEFLCGWGNLETLHQCRSLFWLNNLSTSAAHCILSVNFGNEFNDDRDEDTDSQRNHVHTPGEPRWFGIRFDMFCTLPQGEKRFDGRADHPVWNASDRRGSSDRRIVGSSSVCAVWGAVLSFDKMVASGIDPGYASRMQRCLLKYSFLNMIF